MKERMNDKRPDILRSSFIIAHLVPKLQLGNQADLRLQSDQPPLRTVRSRKGIILLPVRNRTFARLTPSRRRRLSLLPDRAKPAPSAGR